MLLEAELF